jgi:hypothetical protein
VRRMGEDDRVAVVVALHKFAEAAGEAPNSADGQHLATRAINQLLEE